ncbi:hypothetical protein C7M84_021963 [Penaeus vannamei]|uniref:Uncharacterized protein n=1 Tax=Penaeus vannamei TaxID=6689 RepID=A0A3R7MLG2_PENVA|nr:hypothetical protein C7M84_021963 [Penaeus vannamei]
MGMVWQRLRVRLDTRQDKSGAAKGRRETSARQMSALSYIRRRVFGKSWSLLKRVILPTLVLLFVVNALVGNRESVNQPEYSNLIVPGEALDPIMDNKIELKTHKHHEAKPRSPTHPNHPNPRINPNLLYPSQLSHRGIHAVVLNQHSGRVTAKTRFRHVQPRRRGGVGGVRRRRSRWRIIVFAVLVGGVTSWACRRGTRRARADLARPQQTPRTGLPLVEKIAYRDMWAGHSQGRPQARRDLLQRGHGGHGLRVGRPVFLRTDFDLEENERRENPTNTLLPPPFLPDRSGVLVGGDERKRGSPTLLRSNDGYGAMCDCDVHFLEGLFFHADDQDPQIPVEAPGLNRDKVAVYADTHHQGIMDVCKLFGVHLVVAQQPGNSSAIRIRNKFQRILGTCLWPNSPKEQSPRRHVEGCCPSLCLYEHLNSRGRHRSLCGHLQVSAVCACGLWGRIGVRRRLVSPIMERDPTVMGISSFNFFGFRDVANNLTQLYRRTRSTTSPSI